MSLGLLLSPARSRWIAFIAAMSLFGAGIGAVASRSEAAAENTPIAQPITADSAIRHKPEPTTDPPLWVKAREAQTPQRSGPAGKVSVMLELDTESTAATYQRSQSQGASAAETAARAQRAQIDALQKNVLADVQRQDPSVRLLYKSHALTAGLAISADSSRLSALQHVEHVRMMRTIAVKKSSNAGVVPLVQAPAVWESLANQGEGVSIGIIDSGIDYTHADFGGPGTVAAYDAARKSDAKPTKAIGKGKKIAGGYDFVGDTYNTNRDPAPGEGKTQLAPHPDSNPLDCNGHGTHVAGTAAGYGVTAKGSTYQGPYDNNSPLKSLRIGPGVAPKASLYALRVFGCSGATDIIGEALDWAADPNHDGDPSDHLDVVNMSLGSDWGDPDDPDSQAVEKISDLGVVVAIASGNSGDQTAQSGSPGNAPSAVTVAASDDGLSIVDGLEVTSPAAVAGKYSGELSDAYDYDKKPGARDVLISRPLSKSNEDGCDSLNSQDAALVKGKIAWLEWSDDDDKRRCGSAARGANVKKAGAKGFLFAGDTETFSAGISGDPDIPGMLISASATNTISPQLANGVKATISRALHNSLTITRPEDADKVAKFSSRGIHNTGNLKPDLTAPGVGTFSADFGTGNKGASESGTSMATPAVAGVAALVKAAHPDWSAEEIKADLMNTANADVFTGENRTGQRYAPNRVGAGRVDALAAVQNNVVAFNAADQGTVSVSFGPITVQDSYQANKEIRVINKSDERVDYRVGYEPITEVPGANYKLSRSEISLAPRSEQRINLTLEIPDASKLEKTIDPTLQVKQSGLPRQFLADASGRIVLSSEDNGRPQLRIPVYAAPRPVSTMDNPAEISLPANENGNADLELRGSGVQQGSDNKKIISVVSGYELLAQSGQVPNCAKDSEKNCLTIPSQRAGDIRYVGATSNAPALGKNALRDGRLYIAVNTWQPTRAPAGPREFDIFFDTTGDNKPDAVLYTTRITSTDVLVAALVDMKGEVLKTKDGKPAIEALNAAPGNIDTDIFDTDTVVLPVLLSALPKVTAEHSRIHFGVATFDPYGEAPFDAIGITNNKTLKNPLSFNVLSPGITVGDPQRPELLYQDLPETHLVVRRNAGAYGKDHGRGLMIVHHHNADGSRASVVSIRDQVRQ